MKDWKDLYKQSDGEEPSGPVLFYNDIVLDHFVNPRNVGEMENGEAVGFALVEDSSCGDQMKLWIRVEDDIITDIKFKSFGCPGAIATSSMATELAKGKSLEDVRELTDDDVITALGGIPEHKKHCSLLGMSAIHTAIQDYLLKRMMAEAEHDDDDIS
ncbi:MAG: iron-sulfur cluster assembly scaffold protein [Desulfomonilia bacterium]